MEIREKLTSTHAYGEVTMYRCPHHFTTLRKKIIESLTSNHMGSSRIELGGKNTIWTQSLTNTHTSKVRAYRCSYRSYRKSSSTTESLMTKHTSTRNRISARIRHDPQGRNPNSEQRGPIREGPARIDPHITYTTII